jgi:peptidoglycan/LPS O-acetylase OafA/YrhL
LATIKADNTVVELPGADSWRRLDGVDALRSLAILCVLLNHVNIRLVLARVPYLPGLPAQLVSSLFWNGQRGVQIFFVISGFLIASMSLRRWSSLGQVKLRQFYELRFARIAPLFLLLLGVLSFLDIQHVRNFVIRPSTGSLGQALFAALTFHVNLLEARHGYLPADWDVLWSLSVEEMFYLCFPLICWVLSRDRIITFVLLIFVALGPLGRTVLSHGNPIWHEYSYLGSMDAIALGCLTAIGLSRHRLSGRMIRMCAICGALMLILMLGFAGRVDQWGIGRSGLDMTVVALSTCLLIAAAAQGGWKSPRVLRPLLLPGRRSYEIYLTHMFIVFAFFGGFLAMGRPLAAVPILFLAVIVAAILLGELVARLFSEPLNGLLRRGFRRSNHRAVLTVRLTPGE